MKKRVARREDLGLTPAEFATLRRLDTPEKIQQFLYRLRQNFELEGDTCRTVREVLRVRRAHCIEGAMLAACALWVHGEPPLLLDFEAVRDDDHVLALFRVHGHWGAIAKSNYSGLRYREPVYRTLRELAMSYFHEYTNRRDHKTLREYSVPYDLRRLDTDVWVTGKSHAWSVADELDRLRHFPLVRKRNLRHVLRKDPFEREAFKALQYRVPRVLLLKRALIRQRARLRRLRAKKR